MRRQMKRQQLHTLHRIQSTHSFVRTYVGSLETFKMVHWCTDAISNASLSQRQSHKLIQIYPVSSILLFALSFIHSVGASIRDFSLKISPIHHLCRWLNQTGKFIGSTAFHCHNNAFDYYYIAITMRLIFNSMFKSTVEP